MNTRINILQWILTKLGTYLVLKRIWNPIDFQGQGQIYHIASLWTLELTSFNGFWPYLVLKRIWNPIDCQGHWVKFLPCNVLVNTRINILQWILTKLGTYLVLRRVWNPIDFQGHKSKVKITRSNFLLHNILVNILESISSNGFLPNLVHT